MNGKAIGIFDSGLGGISVLNKCKELMPNEDFIYYADKKNAPYGGKTQDEIVKLVDDVVENFFMKKDVKAIVLACNTATNATIDLLRNKYNIPIIGTEPAIKPALLNSSKNNKALVMATVSTVNSKKLIEKISTYPKDNYILMGCAGLVELIEDNKMDEVQKYISEKIETLDTDKITSVVLGCTHYPFVKNQIQKSFKNKPIVFYDGAVGVAKRLKMVLEENSEISKDIKEGKIELYNSLDDSYSNKLKSYLGV